MRIIFAGTPIFAATALAALYQSEHEIVAVYTQPNRPAGRGKKLQASPVKQLALTHNTPVEQPASLKNADSQTTLANYNADIMIVAAYGLLLPQAVLDIPPLGCLNIHASILPRWRGAAPIQRAILAGDTETGISIMQMDAGLDTGDVLLTQPHPIAPNETGLSLHDSLAELGAQALLTALADLPNLTPQKQDNAKACYATKLDKAEACIDWQQDAQTIERMVRAFNPVPGAYTELNGQRLKIWQAQAEVRQHNHCGQLFTAEEKLYIGCQEGALNIQCLQPANKRRMSAQDYLNAHPCH